VKTSILILDKSLARQSDTVGFFKVENDGFNLGAQRRPIDKNDLPQVLTEVNEYLRRLRAKEPVEVEDFTPTRGLIVAKEKIAASGDYNLGGERYRVNGTRSNVFPLVSLSDVCIINPPKLQGLSLPPDTLVSFVPMSDLGENRMTFAPKETKRIGELGTSYTYFSDGDVLVAKVTPCFENGKAGIARNLTNGVGFGSSEFYVLRPSDRVLAEFVYFCVTHRQFREPAVEQMTGTGGLQRVPKSYVEAFEIPLPPLEVQKEIVAEIEAYQRVSDGARAVLDHYRPHIPIQPDWPMVELGEISELISGRHVEKDNYNTERRGISYLTGPSDFGPVSPTVSKWTEHPEAKANRGDVLITVKGSGLGSINLLDIEEAAISRQLMAIRVKDANPAFVHTFLLSKFEHFQSLGNGAAIPGISREHVLELRIPLPPLEVQRSIVSEIEAERRLVEANRELIARMEKKIAATLARIWGEPEAVENRAAAEPQAVEV
jgi:type I restriction enzyme M protein